MEEPIPFVIKRDGTKQAISYAKIERRIEQLVNMEPKLHSSLISIVSQRIIASVVSEIQTRELDQLGAEYAAYSTTKSPDYGVLATRIIVSSMHKETPNTFSASFRKLYDAGMIPEHIWDVVETHGHTLDSAIMHENDYQ